MMTDKQVEAALKAWGGPHAFGAGNREAMIAALEVAVYPEMRALLEACLKMVDGLPAGYTTTHGVIGAAINFARSLERAERPNVHAEVLLSAGKRYGDACVVADRIARAWQRGDDRAEMESAWSARREAEYALLSAARSYATRMRRKRKLANPVPGED